MRNGLRKNNPKRDSLIWGVCNIIRLVGNQNPDRCMNCPEWEDCFVEGRNQPCKKMCYGLAENALQIAREELPVTKKGRVIRKHIRRINGYEKPANDRV